MRKTGRMVFVKNSLITSPSKEDWKTGPFKDEVHVRKAETRQEFTRDMANQATIG